MFIDIDNGCTTPGKQEVAKPSSDDNSNTQPNIVRHEDEHQHVADCDLDNVKQRLNCVSQTHHVMTTTTAATSTAATCIHTHMFTEQSPSNKH